MEHCRDETAPRNYAAIRTTVATKIANDYKIIQCTDEFNKNLIEKEVLKIIEQNLCRGTSLAAALNSNVYGVPTEIAFTF